MITLTSIDKEQIKYLKDNVYYVLILILNLY
jgi:hypothetical protein